MITSVARGSLGLVAGLFPASALAGSANGVGVDHGPSDAEIGLAAAPSDDRVHATNNAAAVLDGNGEACHTGSDAACHSGE
jgi:hypothetical protein